jgi:Right handed beta helix region
MKPATSGAVIAVTLLLLGAAVTQRDLNGNPLGLLRRPVPDFVVTNPRDAGPATLRDAILAADRLSSRAHIQIAVERIAIESALPALTNSRGVDIDAKPRSVTIDAAQQPSGATLQLNSPASSVRDLHIVNAHGTGIIVNASGVELGSVTVGDSKLGVLLTSAARGCTIRAATFERNETAVLAQPGIHDVTISESTFTNNSRAAFWFVSAADKATNPPVIDGPGTPEHVRILDSIFTQNTSGIVVANQPTLVRKSHFIGNRDSAVLVLGGSARVEESEIRATGGTAISVNAGRGVELLHNTLADNVATAIMASDSTVTIAHNSLEHNGVGIVAIVTHEPSTAAINDNTITRTTGDALLVIGGSTVVERNQVLGNHGVALRMLDLVTASGRVKASPHLDGNLFKGNAADAPVPGDYKMTGTP